MTMQGRSAWWSVIREQCILEESTRREREGSQVSGVWAAKPSFASRSVGVVIKTRVL